MDPKNKDLDKITLSSDRDSAESILSEVARTLDDVPDQGYLMPLADLNIEVKYLHDLNSSEKYQ